MTSFTKALSNFLFSKARTGLIIEPLMYSNNNSTEVNNHRCNLYWQSKEFNVQAQGFRWVSYQLRLAQVVVRMEGAQQLEES